VCACAQVKLGDHVTILEHKEDEDGNTIDDKYVARIIELWVDPGGNRRLAVQWMYRLQVGTRCMLVFACAVLAKCVSACAVLASVPAVCPVFDMTAAPCLEYLGARELSCVLSRGASSALSCGSACAVLYVTMTGSVHCPGTS
jgi:hypothetical protein